MGFYTRYFSTIFKGLGMTSLKQRIEIGKIVKNLSKADHILYHSLFEHVEKTHEVTRAIEEEKKILADLRIAAVNAEALMFNLETEDMTLLRVVEDILKELEQFPTSQNPTLRKIERDFALAILRAIKFTEEQDRDEYRQVETIINLAEKHDIANFMKMVRLRFQTEQVQTVLAKFAGRVEIRRAKADIRKLQQVPSKLNHIRTSYSEDKYSEAKTVDEIKELHELSERVKIDLEHAFRELFWLMKRDTLFMLKILVDLNNLFNFNNKWIGKSYMPLGVIKEKNNQIFEIEKKVAEEFHAFAQGFRIIIAELEKIEKKAEQDASR